MVPTESSFQSSSSKPQTCEGSYHGPSKPAHLPTEYHRMALVKATWSRRSAHPSISTFLTHKIMRLVKMVVILSCWVLGMGCYVGINNRDPCHVLSCPFSLECTSLPSSRSYCLSFSPQPAYGSLGAASRWVTPCPLFHSVCQSNSFTFVCVIIS